jgi:polyisoprenyl-phosphate glycosyltransferase
MELISVVIPVYNSEQTLAKVVEQISKTLKNKDKFEIILVDDYSNDNSRDVCKNIAEKNSNIKVVCLNRNFGQHNARMAGLHYAKGQYIVFIDDDLQNPPESIFLLIDEIRKGYDVVYSFSERKSQSLFKNFGSKANDIMARLLLNKPKWLKFSSYCIINSFLAEELKKYTGAFPYPGGMILQITAKIGQVKIEHRKRTIGSSNYTISKLLSLWLNGFTGFSIAPLRIASVLGLSFCIISMIFVLFLVLQKMLNPSSIVAGWTSVMVVTLFSYGILMLLIGLVGEYVGRVLMFVNRKPQFVVSETINIEK